jgi:hypothetical protein
MSFAPDSIEKVRLLLIEHLGPHAENPPTNRLKPKETGIVGNADHDDGYHLGKDRTPDNDYSVIESDRDRRGLTNAAAALDIGMFSTTVNGRAHNLRTFSAWLVKQCKAGTDDTQDIREVIYSLDGDEVKRWDRLRKRDSGDGSHRTHTHVSYFRDSQNRDKTALYIRFLTEIGLLEEDMDQSTFNERMDSWWLARMSPNAPDNKQRTALRVAAWQQEVGNSGRTTHNVLFGDMKTLLQQAAGDDTESIIAGVLAGLTAEQLADVVMTALPPGDAKILADELTNRVNS